MLARSSVRSSVTENNCSNVPNTTQPLHKPPNVNRNVYLIRARNSNSEAIITQQMAVRVSPVPSFKLTAKGMNFGGLCVT
jgi:hypothetical protein